MVVGCDANRAAIAATVAHEWFIRCSDGRRDHDPDVVRACHLRRLPNWPLHPSTSVILYYHHNTYCWRFNKAQLPATVASLRNFWLEPTHLRRLTLSPPIPLRLYTLPYWSNPPFFIFDIRALWRSVLSARAPECQKLKMVGYTSMALNPLNSSNLKQLALKGLTGFVDFLCSCLLLILRRNKLCYQFARAYRSIRNAAKS